MGNDIKKIGWDPGFGYLKIAMVNGTGETHSASLPAEVGLPASTDEINIGGVVRTTRTEKPFRVRFNGSAEYLVGPNLSSFTKPIPRMDFERFTDSTELRASMYVALYKLLGPGNHRVMMVVSLPVAVLPNEEETKSVERRMGHWICTSHTFEVDGDPCTVEITKIRVIPQPVAAWMYWGLNSKGNWARGADEARAPAAVIDQGYNTLDIVIVSGGRVRTRESGGENLGMSQAGRSLRSTLRRKYGLKLDLREADELIVGYIKTRSAKTYVDGGLTDITTDVKQSLDSLASDAVDFATEHIDNPRGYKILLTGGGNLALLDRMKQAFPMAELLEPADLAGAIGLAYLAQKPSFIRE